MNLRHGWTFAPNDGLVYTNTRKVVQEPIFRRFQQCPVVGSAMIFDIAVSISRHEPRPPRRELKQWRYSTVTNVPSNQHLCASYAFLRISYCFVR